jgi:exonuclease III
MRFDIVIARHFMQDAAKEQQYFPCKMSKEMTFEIHIFFSQQEKTYVGVAI